MQDLRVIGVENGALLVVSDDGTRFRIPIDEVLQSKLRQSIPDPGTGRRIAPKDIQAHIRSGMSAQDVASITGAALEYIQRFEGPVMAEREYVVESALAVAVHTAADTDPLGQGQSFGAVIRDRLRDLGGTSERWASWKEATTGWVVKLSFTVGAIDHDARWQFDPKKQSLSPINSEAITLSQQGEATGALIPRLRAVGYTETSVESARFDSGAFTFDDEGAATGPLLEVVQVGRIQGAAEDSATHGNQTADLLEALRRRRGERESAPFDDEDGRSSHPSTGSIHLIDEAAPTAVSEPEPEPAPRPTAPQPTVRSGKKGRVAMPSWDEIVFGARPDDDLP